MMVSVIMIEYKSTEVNNFRAFVCLILYFYAINL